MWVLPKGYFYQHNLERYAPKIDQSNAFTNCVSANLLVNSGNYRVHCYLHT